MVLGGGEAGLIAGVELGGTKCVCVLGDRSGAILKQVRIETVEPDQTLSEIGRVLSEWQAAKGFDRLGIASFGPIDIDPKSPGWGQVLATTKRGWQGANIASALRDLLGVPVALDTDVVGAALAEGRWGAALGLDDYAYVTVGTGVGVGVIAHGRPLGGFGHSELGHIRVGRMPGDAWPGACVFHGDCVEGLASGPAIAARAGRPAPLLAENDPAWDTVVAAIAGLLQTLVLTAAPRLILIGGGVIAENPQLLDRIRAALLAQLGGYVSAIPLADQIETYLRAPKLDRDAGPLGSLAVALREIPPSQLDACN